MKLIKLNKRYIIPNKAEKINILNNRCYLPIFKIRIIHLIITRFLMEVTKNKKYIELLYSEKFIQNGIRVMKKYLFASLENQSCKNFTFILLLGNKANITYIKDLLNLNTSFESNVIYQKDLRNYIRNTTKGFDVLITTRIDYDDIIYYDAVNDVRKAINIHKPLLLYGYKRGLVYYESDGKYYNFYSISNGGCIGLFASLIIFLNKVNDTYTIYDIGNHILIRKIVLTNYKSFGIKNLNYDPAIFDSGDPKFIYVRQAYSLSYNYTHKIRKEIPLNNLNLSLFFNFPID